MEKNDRKNSGIENTGEKKHAMSLHACCDETKPKSSNQSTILHTSYFVENPPPPAAKEAVL